MVKGKKEDSLTIKCVVSKDPWKFKVRKCELSAPSKILETISFPSSPKKLSSKLKDTKVTISVKDFPKSNRFHFVNREIPIELVLTFPHWPKEDFSSISDVEEVMKKNSRSLILFDNFLRRESETKDLVVDPLRTSA